MAAPAPAPTPVSQTTASRSFPPRPLVPIRAFECQGGLDSLANGQVTIAPTRQPVTLDWALEGVPDQLQLEDAATGMTWPLDLKQRSSTPFGPVRRRQRLVLKAITGNREATRTVELAARGTDLLAGDAVHPRNAYANGRLTDAAGWRHVTGLAAHDGCLLFSEGPDHTIRRAGRDHLVGPFAGRRGCFDPGDPGTPSDKLNRPGAMAVLGADLFVVDEGTQCIKSMPLDGHAPPVVFAGRPHPGSVGSRDGVGDQATFSQPCDIAACESARILLVVERGSKSIRMVEPDGRVTTRKFQELQDPAAIAVDPRGRVYLADAGKSCIFLLEPEGGPLAPGVPLKLKAIAGVVDRARRQELHNGAGLFATFSRPTGLCLDAKAERLFVADTGHHCIRQIVLNDGGTYMVSTLAGDGRAVAGFQDSAAGPARFDRPSRLALLGPDLFVADQDGTALRRVALDGREVATPGCNRATLSAGAENAADPRNARFSRPMGVAMDSKGCAYVADHLNHAIRRILPGGAVDTYAGRMGEPVRHHILEHKSNAHGPSQVVLGDPDQQDGHRRDQLRLLNPTDLGIDGKDRIFVLEPRLGRVGMLENGAVTWTDLGSRGQGAACMAVSPDAAGDPEFFLAARHPTRSGSPRVRDAHDIWKYTWGWPEPVAMELPGVAAMAARGDSQLFIATRDEERQVCTLRKFARSAADQPWAEECQVSFGPGAQEGNDVGFPEVTGMAVDRAGNLFLADAANGIVWGAGPDLASVTRVAGQFPAFMPVAAPQGLDDPLYRLHGITATAQGDLVLTSGNAVIQITAPGFQPAAPAGPPEAPPLEAPAAPPARTPAPPPAARRQPKVESKAMDIRGIMTNRRNLLDDSDSEADADEEDWT